MAEPRTTYIKGDGLRLNVLEAGAGPPVLLIHGFPDSLRLWRHQVPALTEAGFRCVAPDLRGFGESDKPAEVAEYAMPHILNDVVAILDQLGLERASVVGHDWGAGVGWLLATYAPERVDRLVAISVGHPGGFSPPFLPQLQKSWYMFLFQFPGVSEEALQRDDWLLFREWLQGAPDTESYLEELAKPGALTAGLNWYRANVPPESFALQERGFPSIDVPVLGIWGVHDPYLTEELMTRSERFIKPGLFRYERVDDAGHWLPLEQPEHLNRLLTDFLSA